MIQSMTGYGKHSVQLPSKKITIELKSLNSKNLDLIARLPQGYREYELEYRKLISDKLMRGKIDFSMSVELTGTESSAAINKTLVQGYMQQLGEIAQGDELKLLELALRMPDALSTEKGEIDKQELLTIKETLEAALSAILDFRKTEGKALETDFKHRIEEIARLLKEVEAIDQPRLATIRERLDKAVADLAVEVDQNRFEQELMYYLEKYDITEEKVRLGNHLKYFNETMSTPDSNGKKLGFICQEIGREINTIGSKANYAPMQQLVVQMKDELEKIKEQMLNVL